MRRRWVTLTAGLLGLLTVAVVIVIVQRARYDQSIEDRRVAALESLEANEQNVVDVAVSAPQANGLAEALAELDVDLSAEGTVFAVNRLPGDDYERLMVVQPDGARLLLPFTCSRAHASGGSLLCMTPRDSVVPTWEAVVYNLEDPDLDELMRRPAALPSRARVDPNGEFVAYTEFVSGHDYASAGEFSTRTIVYGLADDDLFVADNTVVAGGEQRFDAADRNYWGVSFFPDGSGDYTVTFGSAETVEILRYGDATQQAEPLELRGSCPSLSPDGRFMVYKKIDFDRAVLGEETAIRLVLHDLDTGQERLLGETRFVDDQVEWLDSDTIVYAVPRDEAESIQPEWDIWSLDLDPTAQPELLVPFADSPAVYRDLR